MDRIHWSHHMCTFPECVARVPVSLWGSGGWGCVRSTSRNRSQPFAAVRNRLREGRMAVPMVSSAKGVIFGGLKRCVASFRMAGVTLRDVQTCVVTCGKSFCVADAILLEDALQFSWQAQSFGRVHRHFAWQAQHFGCVVLRFFADRIVRAASSGGKVQIPWQAAHFVRCDENWRKSRTKHRFWGSKFWGSQEKS